MKYQRTKNIVIFAYMFIVTLILFGISKTDMTSFNELSMSRFAFFFWGSGFAFYYLSIMLNMKATKENWNQWGSLSWHILQVIITLITTFCLMLWMAKYITSNNYPVEYYWVIGSTLFGIGLVITTNLAIKFREKLLEMSNN